ncbi:MAG: HAMP domain-containing sensor histidine kinase [Actinomycetota bacterium]
MLDDPIDLQFREQLLASHNAFVPARSLPRLGPAQRQARCGRSSATIRPREDVELRIHARPWQRDGLRGVAVAGRSTRFAEEQVAGLTSFLVFSGVVTIIAVVIVSWLVVRRALRPLKDLAATADEIGRTGDPGRRLPAIRTKDEVGVLTVSFNGMLERLQSARERLAEALAAQRRFVADASHELRSPLTTVRSNAGFLIEHPDAGSTDRAEALADIAAESERMSRLVEGRLALVRADAGRPVEPVPVDVGLLASDVARKTRRGDRAVRVSLDGVAVVAGDGDALTRLLRILVDNALKHGRGDVDLSVAARDGCAIVSVADRGPGVPDGDLERIFDRFYRGGATGDDGVGLGLAIARSIAEAHGGSIRASNRPEGGAVLTVEVPALPAAEL